MSLHDKLFKAIRSLGYTTSDQTVDVTDTVLSVIGPQKKLETQQILDAIYNGFHKRWMHPMNETELRQAEHRARHEAYWNAMFDMAEMFLGYEKKDVLAPTRWLDDLPKEDLEPRHIANELHNITCKIAAGGELPLAEEIGNLVCRLWAWRPSQLESPPIPSPGSLTVPIQTIIEALQACEASMSPQTYIHTIDMTISQLIELLTPSAKPVIHLGFTNKPLITETTGKRICPMVDRLGNTIYEGSRMTHPNGDTFVVEFCPTYPDDRAWRAKYLDGQFLLLATQINDRGMATVDTLYSPTRTPEG